jgi:hypothetical protein
MFDAIYAAEYIPPSHPACNPHPYLYRVESRVTGLHRHHHHAMTPNTGRNGYPAKPTILLRMKAIPLNWSNATAKVHPLVKLQLQMIPIPTRMMRMLGRIPIRTHLIWLQGCDHFSICGKWVLLSGVRCIWLAIQVTRPFSSSHHS